MARIGLNQTKGKSMNRFAAGVIGIFILVLVSGCSNSAPKCSDQKTIDLVLQIAKQELAKKLSQETLDKVGMNLDAIRTTESDEKTGKQKCAAQMIFKGPGGESKADITYASEKTDKGEQYVTVYGL